MDTTPDDEILLRVADHIAYVTINRPAKANSMTPAMLTWFQQFWRRVDEDPQIRCVLITGSGSKHFCTGADLSGVNERGGVGVGLGRVSQDVGLTSRHNGVWKPTVCAVNGLVTGGGLHFVVDADIIVASTNAVFLDSHVNVGMVGGPENVGLAKRLPLGTALRMSLQGRNFRLSAQRAYQLGLVDELTEPDDLLPTAERIARDITQNSPHAVSLTQQAIWSSLEMPYTQAVEYGFSLVKTQWHHPDYTEGFRAFAEKRAPQWKTD
ncbi:enoyl-CoA hydratase/isomerase family protein [Mycolicibacterium hassiacum DSM 44199]|jgi:enoyl-CoA hydratase/carnithine racemase|uniref:Enoyl-CoA hydratase/isomerase family protein n=1 Tax=Mycolicibacterium hassiacum (strain DSM 44199 / CIP 105218 / JCM 12690 / 3849) TaxID=1122247 RepID=K5BA57_MYCHD|nr:enoyl-CoA hydratase/isomerase family protein [Mycolicibacterium hassiacum]EKF21660.1 enoyl-CoA hydratase/isomerase family protein [Mycolicibacterium hassiacum DSM 44199]MDA4084250.1 enoyl-CoA hydratase [Mycolicibacterium hassiacum DSM 44199]PZN25366.1 MAG: enoyl-CoA hydratase/isomerase family protein [Mycolicibacterium hassiacum]VCT91259.1 Short-chain-enoyl-CoA hydratase [Mycolicibacterium hassiacum DSM 44199]